MVTIGSRKMSTKKFDDATYEKFKAIRERYDQAERDKEWYDNFTAAQELADIALFNRLRYFQDILRWSNQDLADFVPMDEKSLREILNRKRKVGEKRRTKLLEAVDRLEKMTANGVKKSESPIPHSV